MDPIAPAPSLRWPMTGPGNELTGREAEAPFASFFRYEKDETEMFPDIQYNKREKRAFWNTTARNSVLETGRIGPPPHADGPPCSPLGAETTVLATVVGRLGVGPAKPGQEVLSFPLTVHH